MKSTRILVQVSPITAPQAVRAVAAIGIILSLAIMALMLAGAVWDPVWPLVNRLFP